MTQFTFYSNPTLTIACVPAAGPAFFSLEDTARLTGVHPEMLLYYCRLGLIETFRDGSRGECFFNEDTLTEIRQIEHYRRHLGVVRRALPLICELEREAKRRQIEIGFLRFP